MDTKSILSEFKTAIEADAKHIKSRLDSLDSAIVEVSQRQEIGYGMAPMLGREKKQSFATVAADLIEQNADILQKAGRLRLEIKAASDPVTTASGRNVLIDGVGSPTASVLGIQTALETRTILGGTAVEYSRFTGSQGTAAVQAAEGDAKAVIRPDHSIINQTAVTVAAYTTMSRQAMADRTELVRAVEDNLARALATKLDDILWNGVVTPSWAGLDSLSSTHTSAYDTVADAVSDAQATMQLAGFMPNVAVMSPATWVEVMTLRADAGTGLYLSGNYLTAEAPSLRGLRVVLSPSIPTGTAMLMDTSHIELIQTGTPILEAGFSGSDFTNNLQTLLAEIRVAPVFRAVGAAVLAVPAGVSI